MPIVGKGGDQEKFSCRTRLNNLFSDFYAEVRFAKQISLLKFEKGKAKFETKGVELESVDGQKPKFSSEATESNF